MDSIYEIIPSGVREPRRIPERILHHLKHKKILYKIISEETTKFMNRENLNDLILEGRKVKKRLHWMIPHLIIPIVLRKTSYNSTKEDKSQKNGLQK